MNIEADFCLRSAKKRASISLRASDVLVAQIHRLPSDVGSQDLSSGEVSKPSHTGTCAALKTRPSKCKHHQKRKLDAAAASDVRATPTASKLGPPK